MGESSPHTQESNLSAYIATHRLLCLNPRPTAIFAVNDYLCDGVIRAAKNHGLEVPNELSVAGFDHDLYATPPGVNLTTYSHPLDRIASSIVELLNRQLAGQPVTKEHLKIPGRLVVGNTKAAIDNAKVPTNTRG